MKTVASRSAMVVIILLGAAFAWAGPFVTIVPNDYGEFLLPWYEHIRANGPIGAFDHPFSNYTPPYLYLLASSTLLDLQPLVAIKLLSTIGSFWVVVAIYRLLTALRAEHALEGSLVTLLLPTVMFNVPVLAQADMFWVAPCLLAIAAAVRENPLASVFWAGVGFAFKAQAVFLAPFIIGTLLVRRSPWWHWAVPALVYVLAMMPAWSRGWPGVDLLTVYVRQVEYVHPNSFRLVSTASNWWALYAHINYRLALKSFPLGFVAAAAASVLYVRWMAKEPRNQIVAAGLSSAMLPFLLPGMHERFYALSELTVFCWAWSSRSKAAVTAAALMQLQLLFAILGWIFARRVFTIAGAELVTIALALILLELRSDASSLPLSSRLTSITPHLSE